MFSRRIKLPRDLLERARRHAEAAGFDTVDEFVARAVEKELERVQEEPDDDETRKRLEGLGYIS